MDSVYEAARKHADELKAELQAVETFLDLHEHFRGRFGLTEPTKSTPAAATAESEAPDIDAVAAEPGVETHETAIEASPVKTQADDEPDTVALGAAELDTPEAEAPELEAPQLEASELKASEPEAGEAEEIDPEAPVHAEADTEAEGESRIIKASEGVLVAATVETEPGAPLGQAATLQAVAEKLAATIGATHNTSAGAAG